MKATVSTHARHKERAQRKGPARHKGRSQPLLPDEVAVLEDAIVVERPDGYWLRPKVGGPETGPYATLVAAIEGRQAAEDEEPLDEREMLAEAEAEMGVADWIDPDTDEPAEDHVPRLEEH
jgi:hypothetical protein